MKGKKYVLMLTLTFLLSSIIASTPPVKSELYQTRIYVRECPPPAGNVTGVPPGGWVWFIVDIDTPLAWDDTVNGIVGYTFSVKVDPAVLTAWGAYAATFNYFLFDYIDWNGYTGHEPKILVENINGTTGDLQGIGELIFGWESLGTGAGGSSGVSGWYGEANGLCKIRFKSVSQTAYSRVDLYDAFWVDTNGTKHAFDVVEDAHYNAPPFKWQHSQATLIDPTNPNGTSWHELYPNYCTSTTITDWVDNGDGTLNHCDYIKLDSTWWHVEEVTITIETKTAYGEPGSSTNSPSTTSGGWTTGDGAYADGGTSASIDSGKPSASQYYGGYGFAIPTSAVVNSVRVRLDAWTGGNEEIHLMVSEDGGSTWLVSTWNTPLTTTETTYWANVTTWTSWTPAKINSDNIHTQVWAQTVGGGKPVYLDWIPIEVTYMAPLPMYIEYVAGSDFMDQALDSPLNTYWHEVYPDFCNQYEITAWTDSDTSGNLTYCDYVTLNSTEHHVEDVDTDIIVSGPVEAPPEFPLGAALEISLIVAIAYVLWRSRRKTKITKQAKLAY